MRSMGLRRPKLAARVSTKDPRNRRKEVHPLVQLFLATLKKMQETKEQNKEEEQIRHLALTSTPTILNTAKSLSLQRMVLAKATGARIPLLRALPKLLWLPM